MAPKVTASEMMNSHMTSLLEGIENGASSIMSACPPTATLAWLTVPPGITCLQLQPQQEQQVHPKPAHEVPVAGGRFKGAPAQTRNGVAQPHENEQQARQASQHVHHVESGEHVEERTVGIGGEVDALSAQLEPRAVLPDD